MAKNRSLAVLLALAGAVTPVTGLHKFYVGQPRWGLVYLALFWTPLPHVASALEAIWYAFQPPDRFAQMGAGRGGGADPGLQSEGAMGLGANPGGADLEALGRSGWTIDVNKAQVDDWLRIPGFAPHHAQILAALVRSGVQFHCLDDLAAALDCDPQTLHALEPLLCFAYYEPDILENCSKINPNRATLQQLLQIPHMSPALAQTIIHQRILQGHYGNLALLQQRLNLPPNQVEHLMHYLTFRD
ncbi:helix-hairpin-helix domain-containing protein [Prochlorothrix hollandica]|uniref:helix-hairpin-helix domain-containing protein n=1 Tax=Prochlorothrix hollandica TaxID=1223 RepID=UPI0033415A6B